MRSTLRLIDPKAFVCVSNDKVDYISNFLLVKSFYLIKINFMHQILLYSSFFIAVLSLFFGLYACGRVAKVQTAVKDLDWDAVANMTGDLATTKRTIQTLNNRINGMHSPKLQEQELMLQLLQNQGQKANGRMQGG